MCLNSREMTSRPRTVCTWPILCWSLTSLCMKVQVSMATASVCLGRAEGCFPCHCPYFAGATPHTARKPCQTAASRQKLSNLCLWNNWKSFARLSTVPAQMTGHHVLQHGGHILVKLLIGQDGCLREEHQRPGWRISVWSPLYNYPPALS